MFYEFLPLIDEHNKAQQNLLALELKWPTQCCWFRLMMTFIGMAVGDVQRWDQNRRRDLPLFPTPPDEVGEYEEDPTGSIRVYANLISKKLLVQGEVFIQILVIFTQLSTMRRKVR